MRIPISMIAVGAAAALALTGCSAKPAAPSQSSSPIVITSNTASAEAGHKDTSSNLDAVLAAIATAEKAVGGRAIDIDDQDDDGDWEVEVLKGNVVYEVKVSGDGKTVKATERDDVDSDDLRRAAKVKVSMADAIKKALAEVPGKIDEVDLDDKNGKILWEVSIDAVDGTDRDIYVDVETGAIVK